MRTQVNFTTVQSNNIALVYILDSYRPIGGEVIVTQAVFKCSCPRERLTMSNESSNTDPYSLAAFGFLISFYTNPWIEEWGYILRSLAPWQASLVPSSYAWLYFIYGEIPCESCHGNGPLSENFCTGILIVKLGNNFLLIKMRCSSLNSRTEFLS